MCYSPYLISCAIISILTNLVQVNFLFTAIFLKNDALQIGAGGVGKLIYQ
jgi:hypothetical protein